MQAAHPVEPSEVTDIDSVHAQSQPRPSGQESIERSNLTASINRGSTGPLNGDAYNEELEKDSPWARKTILSFDGGGIRGYGSLLIFKELMDKIRDLETTDSATLGPAVCSSWEYPWQDDDDVPDSRFYPCHYFDYMAGTSTGGLSAIMLGRLGMTVSEALSQYADFGNAVFGRPRWFHERSWFFFPRSKHGSKKVKSAILEVVRQGLNLEEGENYRIMNERFAFDEHQCRTMVVSFKKDAKAGIDQHYLYRTFDHLPSFDSSHLVMNPGPASQEPIWHAARATSAAQSYFSSFKLGHHTYLDGGNGANNPSMIALKEVHQLHPHPPSTLISIGTGEKPERPSSSYKKEQLGETRKHSRRLFLKRYLEWGADGKNLLTNTVSIAGDAETLSTAYQTDYVRFQIPNNCRSNGDCLGSIPMDQWLPPTSGSDTLAKIQAIVQEYLADEEVQRSLDYYAYKLVALRRRRATTDRWEKFATDVEYHCSLSTPCKIASRPKNRPTFRRHVYENHRDCFRESQLEAVLSQYRTTARKAASRVNTQRSGTWRNTSRLSDGGLW